MDGSYVRLSNATTKKDNSSFDTIHGDRNIFLLFIFGVASVLYAFVSIDCSFLFCVCIKIARSTSIANANNVTSAPTHTTCWSNRCWSNRAGFTSGATSRNYAWTNDIILCPEGILLHAKLLSHRTVCAQQAKRKLTVLKVRTAPLSARKPSYLLLAILKLVYLTSMSTEIPMTLIASCTNILKKELILLRL